MATFLRFVFAFVFVVMSSASCVQKTSDIKVVVEVINEARNPVPSYSDFLTIRVVVIEGSIWGPPGKEENLAERVEVGSVVSLDTGRLLQMGSRYASTVSADTSNVELVVSPREMRFARLGTFAVKPLTNRPIGSGSFLDKQSRDFLALLYVDRPGLISGTLRAGNIEGKVLVSIDKAGLHWVRMKEVTPSLYELDNANPSELVFGIQPYPVPSLGPSE